MGNPEIDVDVCPRNDGIWFDGGELHQLLHQEADRSGAGMKKVTDFLGDVFRAE